MQGTLTERITRSLAYMLRHQPDEFDLELDAQGFGNLGEVVCALNERLGEPVDDEDVLAAIRTGDRPRYEVAEGRIRALYGHSFEIDPGEPSEPPDLLYVGVGSRDARRASEEGLRSGRRAFLHLSATYEEARETGRRVAPDYAVVTVHARKAFEDGVPFYDRQSLFLSDAIPTEYIEIGEFNHDGVRRLDRRGGRRDERGRERVHGRPGRRVGGDPEDRGGPRRPRTERVAEPVTERATERVAERAAEPVTERDRPPARAPERKGASTRAATSRPGFGCGVFEGPPAEEPRSDSGRTSLDPPMEELGAPPEEHGAPPEERGASQEEGGGSGFGAGLV